MQKVFSREFFTELARECSFNADELRLLGEFRNHEILVDGDTYDMLVRVQDQFERLKAMGDDEYRGFYIEVPRPTLDEWGDCDELIEAGGLYSGMGVLESHGDPLVLCRIVQV